MAQLYQFLVDAELQQYYTQLTSQLKLSVVSHIKQADDETLASIGMTKPEIRRLRKFLKKHQGQQGALNYFKRILTKGQDESRPSSSDGSSLSSNSSDRRSSIDSFCTQTKSLLIKRSAVTVNAELGTGEFGSVYSGIWKPDDGTSKMQVAVKIINKSLPEKFQEQTSFIEHLSHPHVTRLFGVVLDNQTNMLVTELAPMKSLADCLRDSASRTNFSVVVLCNLAAQIADGMAYLESKNFVHRDLAARNVLVFANDKVKICDHGLTRALSVGLDYYKTNVSISLKLPVAWCAPESVASGEFTSASDVWSYGVTLWEIFSYGFQPWAGFIGCQVVSAVNEGQRLDQPERCPKEFYSLMLHCWNQLPSERPRFSEILEGVSQIKATRHIVNRECTAKRSEYLRYSVGDIFIALDKSLQNEGIWKGIHVPSNRVGFFCSADTLPFVEMNESDVPLRKGKVNKKDSDRKSLRPGQRLHVGMISGPQNDLRHVSHVGHDGVMFGEVAASVDESTECLVGVKAPLHSRLEENLHGSSVSLPVSVRSGSFRRSCSNSSLVSDSTSAVTSIISSDTLTDVSSMPDDYDSLSYSHSEQNLESLQLDSPSEDLDDFRIPDISNTSSLMDEVMKIVGQKDEKASGKTKTKPDDDKLDRAFKTSAIASEANAKTTSSSSPPSPAVRRQDGLASSPRLLYQNGQSSVAQKTGALVERANRSEDPAVKINDRKVELSKSSLEMNGSGRQVKNVTENCSQASVKDLSHRKETEDRNELGMKYRRPPVHSEVTQVARDMPASNANDSRISSKNGVLSKLGNALSRRGSNREPTIKSFDLGTSPPPSVSSSSEFLPTRKLSFTSSSSSSLPVQKSGFMSLSTTGLAVTEDDGVRRRQRGVHSFSRMKEKLRLSASIGKRSSAKIPPVPAQPNLNANELFFARLREQEMENARLEEQSSFDEDKTDESSNAKFSDGDCYSATSEERIAVDACDRFPSAESVEFPNDRPNGRPSNDDVTFRDVCSAKQGDSLVSACCPSVVSRDSLHISECSSLTQRSVESNSADDSGTTSLDGHVVSSDSDARCNNLYNVEDRYLPPTRLGSRNQPHNFEKSFAVSESNSVDIDDSNYGRRFSQDKEMNECIQRVGSLVKGVQSKDCLYALSDTDWNVGHAVLLLRLRQRLTSSSSDDSLHCREALVACNWDLEAAYSLITETQSGRESPELVHV